MPHIPSTERLLKCISVYTLLIINNFYVFTFIISTAYFNLFDLKVFFINIKVNYISISVIIKYFKLKLDIFSCIE